MINKHANQMVFVAIKLQVVGDHSAIIIGPVLSVYLLTFFIK